MLTRALFLDRDGIINERLVGEYVQTPEAFHLLPDVLPILSAARRMGYKLILITNQQGVGKGLVTLADLDQIHNEMKSLLAEHHLAMDAIYACSDLAASASPRCKPPPGMPLEVCDDHRLNPSHCWLLGESITDAQAGRAAGVRTALVGEFKSDQADLVELSLKRMTPRLGAAIAWPGKAKTSQNT